MGRSGDDNGGGIAERARERLDAWRDWFLLDGSRALIGVGIAALFGAAFGALRALGAMPLGNAQPTFYLFGGLVSGNLTLITVVVSINQLLLSQELSTPGQLETQIQNVVDYREGIEDTADRLAPVEPMGFLRLLFENTRQEAQQLGGLAAGTTPPEANERIDELVEEITDHLDRLDELLQRSPDIFNVLSITLATNYARRIHEIRRLRERHGAELSDQVTDSIDQLIDSFQDIDIARQYFKSIYLKIELSRLSRLLFYTGIPAEIAAGTVLYALTASSGAVFPARYSPAVFVAATAVGFLPLAVLCSYVLRITVVTQRTAAITPFTTPEQER